MFDDRDIDPDRIVFSDEACSCLYSYVKKQNWPFWESENPHVVLSKTSQPLKVTVWAFVSSKRIYLRFLEGAVTVESY